MSYTDPSTHPLTPCATEQAEMDRYEQRETVKENIDFDRLCSRYPYDDVECLLELIVDVLYSDMHAAIDAAMSTEMQQMELYCTLGRLVSNRPEKGAAVAAAEYLAGRHPDATGFSPRNLRRMRDFYRMYEESPELLELAMEIGWTQNVVILEAELSMEERHWYLHAVKQFNWSKAELLRAITSEAHLDLV